MCYKQDANVSMATTEQAAMSKNYGQNLTLTEHGLAELFATINIYYTPILIILGCFGNLLSMFVFYSSHLRLQSASVYLSALVFSDTLFLIQLVPPWLDAVQFSMIFFMPEICYTIVYISYVTCCLSAWIVVAFTVERLLAVLYPLQRNIICTVNRAKFIVLFLTCAVLLLNIPVLKFVSPENCSIDREYLEHAARFNIVDTAVAFFTPFILIFVLNARIMYGVWKLDFERKMLVKFERESGPSRVRNMRPSVASSQQRVTRMLLVVSSVFITLNLPAYTMRIVAYTMTTQQQGGNWALLQQIASIFFNTNFGINFVLYCLSGQNFRDAFYQTIPCLRRRRRKANAIRTICQPTRSITSSCASAAPESIHTPVSLNTRLRQRRFQVRRHRSEPVIRRWVFDNSRADQVQSENIEMTSYDGGGSEVRRQLPSGPRRVIETRRLRTVPFNLFPYRNLIIPRHKNRTTYIDLDA